MITEPIGFEKIKAPSLLLAKDLITDSIIPLRTSDSGLNALSWMEEYRVSHLPIVNNEEFLGMISDADIYNLKSPDEPLGNHILSLSKAYVIEDQHVFDVIKVISTLNLSIVPVLDHKNKYLGVITLFNLIYNLSTITSVNNPGSIIVLELNANDFSCSEITQIIESNDAKILSFYLTSHTDSTKLEITIKMNRLDIAPILQTFYRYNYVVKATFGESDFNDGLQDRFDSLMNYLNL